MLLIDILKKRRKKKEERTNRYIQFYFEKGIITIFYDLFLFISNQPIVQTNEMVGKMSGKHDGEIRIFANFLMATITRSRAASLEKRFLFFYRRFTIYLLVSINNAGKCVCRF